MNTGDQLLATSYGIEFLETVLPDNQWEFLRQALRQNDYDVLPPIAYALLIGAIQDMHGEAEIIYNNSPVSGKCYSQ